MLVHFVDRHINDFDMQSIANLAWAVTAIAHLDRVLLDQLARTAVRADDSKTQAIAAMVWAFAAVGPLAVSSGAVLFHTLAKAVERRATKFSAQMLASMAWGFAVSSQADSVLFGTIATVSEQRLFRSSGWATSVHRISATVHGHWLQ
eukprot:gnl/TRDRNA2_/TRDRNA2_165480_c1_seq5.p1 gnl/TRDRNA2_/TRDRNA2_165480_c1~~gnl/TRDRNA2_/TRDRNA2_165480_c1_seq5.p1  ORF type:complete len:148 (+),score=13.03 gnl/TRDRNA2_/TRDRNA2_165480_c1_seq5:57-500(+)